MIERPVESITLNRTVQNGSSATEAVSLGTMPEEGGEDDQLRADLLFNDPTPLFLPTPFNSGQVDTMMTSERSSGTSFRSIEPKLIYPLENNRLDVPDVVAVPEDLLRALDALEHPLTFDELARADHTGEALPSRTGWLEVRAIESGTLIQSFELTERSTDVGLEQPIELLMMIENSGFWSAPPVINNLDSLGEGVADLENVSQLLGSLRLGAHLRPGIYRILLGP